MHINLNVLHTCYTMGRGALRLREFSFPYLGQKISELAHGLVLIGDICDTAYVGWQLAEKLRYKATHPTRQQIVSDTKNQTRFYIDLVVKALTLAALGALFVKGSHRFLKPKLDPASLLSLAGITDKNITAAWTKTPFENFVTGLFFCRTVLDLYLAYLTSQKLPLLHAIADASVVYKSSLYHTLQISHLFDDLLSKIDYSYNIAGVYSDLNKKFFDLPIRQVKALFYLNTEGVDLPQIITKIQDICTYSTTMFNNSVWDKFWTSSTTRLEYYHRLIRPIDIGVSSFNNSNNYSLVYTICLRGNPPPAPLEVHVFHKHEIWQPFIGLDVQQWIPRFWIPAQTVPFSKWIIARIEIPLTTLEKKWLSFFKARTLLRKIIAIKTSQNPGVNRSQS